VTRGLAGGIELRTGEHDYIGRAGKYISMPLASIDPLELGDYKESSLCPWASRNEAAHQLAFVVAGMGGDLYLVQRSGGVSHDVWVCMIGGMYLGDCDCHDWTAYGVGFHRACIHIWRVIQTQAVGVC